MYSLLKYFSELRYNFGELIRIFSELIHTFSEWIDQTNVFYVPQVSLHKSTI